MHKIVLELFHKDAHTDTDTHRHTQTHTDNMDGTMQASQKVNGKDKSKTLQHSYSACLCARTNFKPDITHPTVFYTHTKKPHTHTHTHQEELSLQGEREQKRTGYWPLKRRKC